MTIRAGRCLRLAYEAVVSLAEEGWAGGGRKGERFATSRPVPQVVTEVTIIPTLYYL